MATALSLYVMMYVFVDGKFDGEAHRVRTWVEPRARVVEIDDCVDSQHTTNPRRHDAIAKLVAAESVHDVALVLSTGRVSMAIETLEHFLARQAHEPDRVCRLRGRFVHAELDHKAGDCVHHIYRFRGELTEFG